MRTSRPSWSSSTREHRGTLDVQFQSLWLDRARGERIIVMTPVDHTTDQRLERLDSLVGAAPAWTARSDSADGSAAGA
ncbi:hypothetical protein AB0M10_19535 [Streptomyces sp. NPDC051840]|uniref:hypothetical protein n=1 Tax=Streptomyces sp. NPDC051840 TaxID=3154752 RepID=UPI0034164EF8